MSEGTPDDALPTDDEHQQPEPPKPPVQPSINGVPLGDYFKNLPPWVYTQWAQAGMVFPKINLTFHPVSISFFTPPLLSVPPLLPLVQTLLPAEREAARRRALIDALTLHFGDTDPRLG